MKCPVCQSSTLAPTRLAFGLNGYGCRSCRGALVSLLAYRDWQEGGPAPEASSIAPPLPVDDTAGALNCPKCDRVMTKYRINNDTANRLDLCAHCGEFWADPGEWEAMASLHVLHHAPAVFSDHWQSGLRAEEVRQQLMSLYRETLGDDVIERVDAFAEWINGRGDKNEITGYLRRLLDA